MKKTITSVNEEWFRKYVTDALGFEHDCYMVCVVDDGHISLLRIPLQSNEVYGQKEQRLAQR